MAERVFTQAFVVVGAIIERDGKILLVQENIVEKGKWNQPAGWLDVEEDPLHALVREVKEETGYDFSPQRLLGIYSLVRLDRKWKHGVSPHALKLVFIGSISGHPVATEEIAQIKWFSPQEIEEMNLDTLRDLDIKQEVKDYFAGKSYPLEIMHHTVSRPMK